MTRRIIESCRSNWEALIGLSSSSSALQNGNFESCIWCFFHFVLWDWDVWIAAGDRDRMIDCGFAVRLMRLCRSEKCRCSGAEWTSRIWATWPSIFHAEGLHGWCRLHLACCNVSGEWAGLSSNCCQSWLSMGSERRQGWCSSLSHQGEPWSFDWRATPVRSAHSDVKSLRLACCSWRPRPCRQHLRRRTMGLYGGCMLVLEKHWDATCQQTCLSTNNYI